MRWWQLLIAWVVLTAGIRLVLEPTVWTAPDVDALNGGVQLAEALTSDGSLTDRLEAGFEVAEDDPKAAALEGQLSWGRAIVHAPLPRWWTGLSVMLAPPSGTNVGRARWGAAAAGAGAVVLVAGCAGVGGFALGLLAGLLMLLLPGVVEASTGSGGLAVGALVGAGLLGATVRMLRTDRGAWLVGVTWGLTLAYHPGAAFLLIPIFSAVAIARRPAPAAAAERHGAGGHGAGGHVADGHVAGGHVALPAVRVGVFLVPLVGLVVLVALWPALWKGTAKHLFGWLASTWWLPAPEQVVAGVPFDQAIDRAPQAWTAFAQWVGAIPLPVLAAWLAGVWEAWRQGRSGAWFPILTVATLVLVGAVDGSLWGGRASLAPLLWACTALTAATGVLSVARWIVVRDWLAARSAVVAVSAAVLALPLLGMVQRSGPSRLAALAVDVQVPLPLDVLGAIAEATPGANIHIVPDRSGWALGIDALYSHGDLDLGWAALGKASWVVILDVEGRALGDKETQAIAGREPTLEGTVSGMGVRAYRLR